LLHIDFVSKSLGDFKDYFPTSKSKSIVSFNQGLITFQLLSLTIEIVSFFNSSSLLCKLLLFSFYLIELPFNLETQSSIVPANSNILDYD